MGRSGHFKVVYIKGNSNSPTPWIHISKAPVTPYRIETMDINGQKYAYLLLFKQEMSMEWKVNAE